MVSFLNSKGFPKWLDEGLDVVEEKLFAESQNLDTSSPTFYVYKPFPKSLSKQLVSDWARLQVKALSPFVNGEARYFISGKGLSVWATPHLFSGVPETQAQQALPDGSFNVKGECRCYHQAWQSGVLTECYEIPCDDTADIVLDTTKKAWALPRKLDVLLKRPLFWGACLAGFSGLFLLWFLVAFGTMQLQLNKVDSQAQQLESELGDKLEMQSVFQEKQGMVAGVYAWRNEYRSLQNTLSIVVAAVLEQSTWEANSIEWQSNVLNVELVSTDIDIASLVRVLENNPNFEQASIRPHSRANTWQLEVTLHDSAYAQK